MKTPTAAVNLQTAPKTEPSIKSKSAEHKTKTSLHLEPQKRLVEPLNFKPLRLNIELFLLKPLNLYVRPVSGTFMWNLLALMWNLDPKSSCGTFMRKSLCEVFIRNFHDKPFCKTFMWNLYVELREAESFCGTFLWNLGTFICGTWELVRVEPLCRTLGNLNS